jgi:hypothetical protein
MHEHLRAPERGQHADLGRPQRRARREHRITDAQILAARTHIGTGRDRAVEGDVSVTGLGVLLRNDGVGAWRQRRPRENPDRFADVERARRDRPRGHGPDNGQPNRRAPRIGGAHRIPVHGGIRPRRNLARRHDRLRQRPAKRRHERHALDRQGLHARQDLLERFLDTEHAAHSKPARTQPRRRVGRNRSNGGGQ